LRTACLILIAVAVLARGSPVAADALPDSGELSCMGAAGGACNYTDRASGLQFHWPTDWPVRRLKLVTQTGQEARGRYRDAIRWIAVAYQPDDENQPEVPLVSIAVLRSSDWLVQSAQAGPTDGVEVATARDHVAVATVPIANPYPPGSRDAEIFDALTPTYAEVSRIVQLPVIRRRGR